MNVKKAYVEIARILNDNKSKKVSTILPQLMEIMTAKSGGGSDIGKTFLKDDEGNVVAIYCYYHKKWEPLDQVEFGSKKSSTTGYNTMCKEGVSNWTKQNRQATKAKEKLLVDLQSGEIEQDELTQAMEAIEEDKQEIVPRKDGIGYDHASDINL